MISSEQIRAARALLDWTTAMLAQKTGLTVNGLNKIERGRVTAQKETLDIIQKVFEGAGIEFLSASGLRKKGDMFVTFEGKECNQRLALDVYDHLKDTGGELLIVYDNEDDADVYLDRAFMEEQFEKRRRAHITHRLLSGRDSKSRYECLNDTFKKGPAGAFSKYPIFIYGSRVALLSPEFAPKVIIIEHERIAQSARSLFNFLWQHPKLIALEDEAPHKNAAKTTRRGPHLEAGQIRAARAFLDWTTTDLAKQTGLTVGGLNKIERGHVAPQDETLASIQRVFAQAGLEFLPLSGFKMKENFVEVWNDEESLSRLLDDVYFDLRQTGGEVCVFGVDEKQMEDIVGQDKLRHHMARLNRVGASMRCLVKEGDRNLMGLLESYHQLPAPYFHPEPCFIYGGKLAFVSMGSPPVVVIIDDIRMAGSVQKLFDLVWQNTKQAFLV